MAEVNASGPPDNLRDWLAGQALPPLLTAFLEKTASATTFSAKGGHTGLLGEARFDAVAVSAYAVADAMLRASGREK